MPAVDPFSASSRPMIPFDAVPSNPLPFASTLQTLDPNLPNNKVSLSSSSSSSSGPIGLGRPSGKVTRQYNNPLPDVFPSPIWTKHSHSRASSVSSEVVRVGSDEWMDAQLQICIDKAEPTLHLQRMGLTSLSTKIADLQHLVTFPSSSSSRSSNIASSSRLLSSPSPSPLPTLSPSPSPLPLPPHPTQSPGRDHFSADARPFGRTVSAPAAASSFQRNLNGHGGNGLAASAAGSGVPGGRGLLVPRGPIARVPSGLSRTTLLESPVISEAGEDAVGSDTTIRVEVDGSTGTGETARSPAQNASPRRHVGQRTLGRSHTRAVLPAAPVQMSSKGPEVWLKHNELTRVNTIADFAAHNKLKILPAAIGALHSLKELNISNNLLQYVPHTLLSLKLETLNLHPNRFLELPEDTETRSLDGGILAPLTTHYTAPVPSLYSLCASMLISPREPSGQPPLLEYDRWDAEPGKSHPLHDPETMHQHIPAMDVCSLTRVLQAARSIATDLERQAKSASGIASSHRTTLTASTSSSQSRTDLFPNLHFPSKPDNAAENPYYSPCTSPKHHIRSDTAEYGHATRQLYLKPAEERIEWRSVGIHTNIPVLWSGCSPGCLRFLVVDEDAEWDLSSDDEE